MSSNTKVYEEKMKSSVEHLGRELAAVRAGRANPAVLDKVTVDYYGAPTPIQQVASVAVSEARTLTITPWDRTLLRAISKAIMGRGGVRLHLVCPEVGHLRVLQSVVHTLRFYRYIDRKSTRLNSSHRT